MKKLMITICLILVGACLGFLTYNYIQASATTPDDWADFVIASGVPDAYQIPAYYHKARQLSKDIPKMKKIIEADWKNTSGLLYFRDICDVKISDTMSVLLSPKWYYDDRDFNFNGRFGEEFDIIYALIQSKWFEIDRKTELTPSEKDFMAFFEEFNEKYLAIWAYRLLKNLGY